MLLRKFRLKMLNKLAQVPGAPASPASPASPMSPASPTSPTSPMSPSAPTVPSSTPTITKQPSQPASNMMNLGTGWSNWAQPINVLVAKIDKVIIAGTAQKYNFNDLFQNKFPSGIDTEFPPPNPTKDVITFARLIYQNIMNMGRPFPGPLKNVDMRNRINALLQSPALQKFQQINLSGPLGSVGVDLSTMRSDLLTLFNSIPVQ